MIDVIKFLFSDFTIELGSFSYKGTFIVRGLLPG